MEEFAERSGAASFPVSDMLAALELRGRTWCLTTLAADAGFSVASSDAIILHAVLEGSVWLNSTSGRALRLNGGDAIVMLSGEAHALRSRPGVEVESCAFLKTEQTLSTPLVRRIGKGPFAARIVSGRMRSAMPTGTKLGATVPTLAIPHANQGAVPIGKAMMRYLQGDAASVLLTRYASLLISEALRDHLALLREAATNSDALERVRKLIAASPRLGWTVESLAREAAMSRSSFAARFTALIGMPPMAYVTELRMETAKGLLRQSAMSVADVAEAAGYNSEVAFVRRFTTNVGESPSAFRKREQAAGGGAATAAKSGLLLGPRPRPERQQAPRDPAVSIARKWRQQRSPASASGTALPANEQPPQAPEGGGKLLDAIARRPRFEPTE